MHSRAALEHRQNHRQACLIEICGESPRRTVCGVGDQRLNLDQDRARTDDARDDARAAGFGAAVRADEDLRGALHFVQTFLVHREYADLIDASETILRCAHDAKLAARFPFEIQDGVDEVLEQTWSCDRAVFGDVPDDEDRARRALRVFDQALRALANLNGVSGGGFDLRQPHRLNRVDDHDARMQRLDCVQDGNEIRFRIDQQLVAGAQTLRAQAHLRRRFFSADVDDRALFARQPVRELQHQRRLTGAGRAADENDAAGDDPAAKQRVELANPRGNAVRAFACDVGETQRRDCRWCRRARGGRFCGSQRRRFGEGVPAFAAWAATEPTGRLESARGTEEDGPRLSHRS